MKISSINFNGHWEDKISYSLPKNGYEIKKRVYVPDKGENAASIALAWERETGIPPINWVKVYNPYNQSNSTDNFYKLNNAEPQYEIKGYPYLPIGILKASAKLELTRAKSGYDKIFAYTELAKLSAQENNQQGVRKYENLMADTLKNADSPATLLNSAWILDDYKDGFGTETLNKNLQ